MVADVWAEVGWPGVTAIAAVCGMFVAVAALLVQRSRNKDEKARKDAAVKSGVEAASGVGVVLEELSNLKASLQSGSAGGSVEGQVKNIEERLEELEGSMWAGIATVLDAGKRPLVGRGMMKIDVAGLVSQLVVDAEILVEALAESPRSRAELTKMEGGVYANLGVVVNEAEKEGLVRVRDHEGEEMVELTQKGRLLGRILEADKLMMKQSEHSENEPEKERRTGLAAKAPAVVDISPERIGVGGVIEIIALGWIPAGDFESLRLSVQAPSGKVWSVEAHQDLAYGKHNRTVFPDNFGGASTTEIGSYVVRADRVSMDGEVVEWGPEGVFRVAADDS